ncbi:exonuclease 3'-5' domain-containing protein 2 [Solenopsis invicta]|uniref:exonuclease 3'-5' domain-containing protein 2 n=1 Tax=Solenopsis invicta TaxID=13686 RepID=UPI0001FE7F94|nr:exonuclease 3'-5' domain-containing protein 2 [Solenopsis invicta]
MIPARNKMFLVCVTVGLVFLASKYRNNVLRSVKHLYKNIKNRDSSNKAKRNEQDTDSNNNEGIRDKKEIKLVLDKIILADSPEKCDYAVQRIRCDLSDGILGFDCEWVKEGPVSLLQLATNNGVVALFRIGKIGYIPFKLKELLATKHILKVGVSSFEDGQKLVKDYGCRVNGTLDLRTLADSLNLPSRKSLAAMCEQYLNIEMDKLIEVRCGDWDASTLSDDQVAYAACDALASVIIYHKIMEKNKEKYSFWQRLGMFLYNILSSDINVRIHGVPATTVDTRFKVQRSPKADSVTNDNILNTKNKSVARVVDQNTNNEHKNTIPTRIKPLYHNCYLQAPDGDILCTCDRKKAEWYITKNLGKLVETDPYTVRLNFEPSGRALGEVGQYYTQVKLNQCVVCGSNEKFIRKNVVPREYRKYFPLVMKAHQSHDVLLLCPSCHEISNNHDLQLRRKLADMCDAPLIGPMTHVRDNYLHNRRKLLSAVKALKEKLTLPQRQREEYEKYILEHTGQQKITQDLLNALNEQLKNALTQKPIPTKYQPHGLKVVQYFQMQESGLIELERTWREHFLYTMNPKYLPSLWSVRHNQERLTIRQAQNRIDADDAKVAGLTQ